MSVEVFQPPGLTSLQVKAGEDEPHRVEVGATEDGLAAVRVNEGEGLVLNAEATGSGPISSIWERRADATAPWRRVSGEDASTLSIESATSDDAGQYRLTLESRWGKLVGPPMEVAVHLPPRARLVVEGQRGEVRKGEPLTLTVTVTAGTPPFSYQWYRDDREVPAEQGGKSATVMVATNRSGVYSYEAQVRNTAGIIQVPPHEISVLSFHGTDFRDCEDCPKMIGIRLGSFVMGTSRLEWGAHRDESPPHEVAIPYRFAVGVHEVTFSEWDACANEGGCRRYRPDDEGWGRGSRPVINVSWSDARLYGRWLSWKTGKNYRLLSESEWEYVARAGTKTPFHFGKTISTRLANYDGNASSTYGKKGQYRLKTTPVGSFPPNEFGLHDVHGNVKEWVEDCSNAKLCQCAKGRSCVDLRGLQASGPARRLLAQWSEQLAFRVSQWGKFGLADFQCRFPNRQDIRMTLDKRFQFRVSPPNESWGVVCP